MYKIISFKPLLLAGYFSWSVLMPQVLLAQPPISKPEPKKTEIEPLEPVPIPPGPTTFDEENSVPPTGYSPPAFDGQIDNQFNIYRLNFGDAISVNVVNYLELSVVGILERDGTITIPLMGRVNIAGLTIEEAESKISYELSRTLLKEPPQVIVSLNAPRPVEVTLLGEVTRPGYYTTSANAPLSNLLAIAGGSTTKADLRSVIVRRNLVDGTVLEEKVDLYTPLVKGRKQPQIYLQGGDTVVISALEIGNEQDYNEVLVSRTNLVQPTITIRVLFPSPGGNVVRNISLPNGSNFLDVVANLPQGDDLQIKVEEMALLRFDPAKGQVVTQTLNLPAAINGDVAQNLPLKDQDVIVVSRTLLGEIFSIFRTLTTPIRDLFGFASFFNFLFNDNNNNNNNNN